MAGLKSLNESFKIGTAKMHLLAPSGELPLYLTKDKNGVYEAVVGSFESGNLPLEQAMFATDAVAPYAGDGKTIEPITLLIRNGQSPDADRFRKKYGKIDSEAELKAIKEAKFRNKKPKTYTLKESEERDIICCAACIAGWENMPSSSDEKQLMEYTPENAIALLREHQVAVTQILMFMGEQKKFERSSG